MEELIKAAKAAQEWLQSYVDEDPYTDAAREALGIANDLETAIEIAENISR